MVGYQACTAASAELLVMQHTPGTMQLVFPAINNY
jgi:hypothetical protein